MANDDLTDFGNINVPKSEKTLLVKNIFEEVSEKYDLMNDLMSLGIHRIWKSSFLDWMAPRSSHHLLDLAGGTGDIGINFLDRGGNKVTIADINPKMIFHGKKKSNFKHYFDRINWIVCNGENLPFDCNSFDLVSISFGLRNITNKSIALKEVYRVLKPGGRFMCLEFSKVNLKVIDNFYQFWSSNIIPFLGEKISGNRNNYEYLVESIKRFPNQDRLLSIITSAGFQSVRYRNLSGGIAAIHSGWKF